MRWLNERLLSISAEGEQGKRQEESRLRMAGRQFSPDTGLTVRGLTSILQLDGGFSLLSKPGQCQPVAEVQVSVVAILVFLCLDFLKLLFSSPLSHMHTLHMLTNTHDTHLHNFGILSI